MNALHMNQLRSHPSRSYRNSRPHPYQRPVFFDEEKDQPYDPQHELEDEFWIHLIAQIDQAQQNEGQAQAEHLQPGPDNVLDEEHVLEDNFNLVHLNIIIGILIAHAIFGLLLHTTLIQALLQMKI
ncbi:hypothetical protein L218DRAFT_393298 [Marasmius fiardii PR-910]|nr:hypothetical protein L218DRAFT_393298 [Marasmius fiardii PR-910]